MSLKHSSLCPYPSARTKFSGNSFSSSPTSALYARFRPSQTSRKSAFSTTALRVPRTRFFFCTSTPHDDSARQVSRHRSHHHPREHRRCLHGRGEMGSTFPLVLRLSLRSSVLTNMIWRCQVDQDTAECTKRITRKASPANCRHTSCTMSGADVAHHVSQILTQRVGEQASRRVATYAAALMQREVCSLTRCTRCPVLTSHHVSRMSGTETPALEPVR